MIERAIDRLDASPPSLRGVPIRNDESTELTDLGGLETAIDTAEPTGRPGGSPSAESRGFGLAARSKLDLLAQLRDRAIRNLEVGEAEWPFCVKRISFLLAPDDPPEAAYHEALQTAPVAASADFRGELTP
jgi:hypothetical protein